MDGQTETFSLDVGAQVEGAEGPPKTRSLLGKLWEMLQALQGIVEELRKTIMQLRAENAELKRALFGRKSERQRIPPIAPEMRRGKDKSAVRRSSKAKRQQHALEKAQLPSEDVVHEPQAGQLHCPLCDGTDYTDLGFEDSYEYEYRPAALVRRRHRRRKKACRCGGHVVTAPAPAHVVDGGDYGPGLYAHTVVSKCSDSMPLHRLAARFKREGVPLGRSTLTDLFHRSAELCRPLWQRLADLVAADPYVNADETPLRVLDEKACRKGYVWVFVTEHITLYVFSPGRSGGTPVQILGKSPGSLQVDAYSGYNTVCVPEGRTRAGCLAHARRYFYKALATNPVEAQHAIEVIRAVYAVDYEAAECDVLGTPHHLALRTEKSKPLMDEWRAWLSQQQPLHAPKSPMGAAITYAINGWTPLTRFLEDPRIKLDNNVSEGRLRKIALGRKNFLFVGHDVAGENLAVLQTLVGTCEALGIDPQAYLSDVLIRIESIQPKRSTTCYR
jgi:transposase